MKQLKGVLYRAVVAGVCVLSLSCAAEAAESIRVLLSADVARLDIRADGPLWVTDAKGRGQALRAPVQVATDGAWLLVKGIRIQTEQLTVHGGEQGLTLTFPRLARKPNGVTMSSGDSSTEISVAALSILCEKARGFWS